MQPLDKDRQTTEKRTPLRIFQKLDTIRRDLIQRAGRTTRSNGNLKLTIDANETVRSELGYHEHSCVNRKLQDRDGIGQDCRGAAIPKPCAHIFWAHRCSGFYGSLN